MSAKTETSGLLENLAKVLADFRRALIGEGLSDPLADELTIAYLVQSMQEAS